MLISIFSPHQIILRQFLPVFHLLLRCYLLIMDPGMKNSTITRLKDGGEKPALILIGHLLLFHLLRQVKFKFKFNLLQVPAFLPSTGIPVRGYLALVSLHPSLLFINHCQFESIPFSKTNTERISIFAMLLFSTKSIRGLWTNWDAFFSKMVNWSTRHRCCIDISVVKNRDSPVLKPPLLQRRCRWRANDAHFFFKSDAFFGVEIQLWTETVAAAAAAQRPSIQYFFCSLFASVLAYAAMSQTAAWCLVQ